MTARFAVVALLACALLSSCASKTPRPELQFAIDDGAISNAFLRDGPVAAHIVAKSGENPRLVVAFPAGNSGAGLWFSPVQTNAIWSKIEDVRPLKRVSADGAVRYGVEFSTSIDARTLTIQKAAVGSIRILRDYEYSGAVPPTVETPARMEANEIIWERRRIDGADGYFLSVEAINGTVTASRSGEAITIEAPAGARLELRVVALTGDPPLAAIPEAKLFTKIAANDRRLRDVVRFLSYEEKFLAGSWRFDTYFGRDTLMSIALLDDALQPHAIEAGFASVFARLSENGEVAHEEDIGEFALLRRIQSGAPASDGPILDYKMIDDDFMLAPALARYLLDRPEAGPRARAFLARKRTDGADFRKLVRRNLEFVVDAARPYGDAPHWSRLIKVRTTSPPVGNWRDSETGLGGGLYPYDVNVALLPAALNAAARLAESGLLGADAEIAALASEARRLAGPWSKTSILFDVDVDAETARKDIMEAARRYDLSVNGPALTQGDVISFPALALDASGTPIAVMHSDFGYELFFGAPSARQLDNAALSVLRPFPAGLMTPAGMLVANATYTDDSLAADFGPDRYHGAVIWSWHQALAAAGLQRQLNRAVLPAPTRARLAAARCAIDAAVKRAGDFKASELWTWKAENGEMARVPFGERTGDETESNAAQLWSAVLLKASSDAGRCDTGAAQ